MKVLACPCGHCTLQPHTGYPGEAEAEAWASQDTALALREMLLTSCRTGKWSLGTQTESWVLL